MKYATAFLSCGCVLFLVFAPQIIQIFRDDPEVIAVGTRALRFQACALPFMGTVFITNMMLQSCGRGLKASITASARNGLFFIPLILIMPRIFGLTGVEITQALADVLSFCVSVPMAYSELKKMNQD